MAPFGVPRSGFHVHTAVWASEDDRAFATRLARYCARNPVALERLTYDRTAKAVTYRSDKAEGPTAGTETADPLEVLARVLVHIPDKGHVTTRYDGWYANRPRDMRRGAVPVAADVVVPIVAAPRLAPIVAFITQASVIDQILTHLRTRSATGGRAGARSPPSTRLPTVPGATRRPPVAAHHAS